MRNNSLDTFRLFAAFAVIILHVRYGSLPPVAEENIRLLGRFAVPFFFLVSGYFFYQNFLKSGDRYFTKSIQRLLGIFIIACIVYIPIRFEKLSFSFSLLYDGTNLHLWFLSSMIFGLILCWYHYSYLHSERFMIAASLVIILLSLLSDSYSGLLPITLNGDFSRYLLSVPYLFFGTLIAKKNFRLAAPVSIGLIVLGVVMQMVEAVLLQKLYGSDPLRHQFLIGTIPFSFGVFFLSFSGCSNHRLAELGRKYSLSIYVYHQFVNFFLFKTIKFIFPATAPAIFIFSAFLSFSVTLGSLMLINRFLPQLFLVLNGEIKMIPSMFRLRGIDKHAGEKPVLQNSRA